MRADHPGLALVPPPLPRLGKQKRGRDPRDLRMAAFVQPRLVRVPGHRLWHEHVTDYGMLLNDRLGDCDPVMQLHAVQTWTAVVGTEAVPTDSDALTCYEAIGGYRPGDPSTDNGCVERTGLNYWRKTGIPVGGGVHRIDAFAAVNPKDHGQVKATIAFCGAVQLGFDLPVAAQAMTDKKAWTVPRPGAGAKAGSWGGHAVVGTGYDRHGLYVVTWGEVFRVTWGFFDRYCDEAWAAASADFIVAASGKTPDGLDLAGMLAAARAA